MATTSGTSSTNPLYSAGESVAMMAATALAFGTVALEAWRPFPLPDSAYSLFALLTLLASTALWARRPAGGAMLATFLPAIPLASAVLLLEGGAAGASAFTATALAFQLRCVLFVLAGRFQKRREALAEAMLERMPETAVVFIDNDIESEVKVGALREGHVFRLAPGQVIPADGLVTFGSGFVDEAFIPEGLENLKMKGMGSQVYAGTMNRNGTLLVRATSVGSQTFAARLANRIGRGTEASVFRLLAMDGVLTLSAVLFLLLSGPSAALRVFLVASGVSLLAVLASFESGLAAICVANRWLWSPGGLRRLAGTGMLVVRSEGVLSEGRPKLVAVECASLSEDAVLGMLAPLARKLETPAAFAILQELRLRNIPLQPVEFYQSLPDGAAGIVASDEVRWVSLALKKEDPALGALEPFVREHLTAGDELHFLEREGRLEAALAFRDNPVGGAAESVDELRQISLPILLVSSLPKRAISRLKTTLDLEHAQGETTEAETDALMERLSEEGLSPAWIQTGDFRPRKFAAVAAFPQAPAAGTDLAATELTLPALSSSLSFARAAFRRQRSLQFWLFGSQTGLLLLLLGTDSRLAALLHLGRSGTLSEAALAFAGVLPGFLAIAFAAPSMSARGLSRV